MGVNTQLLAKVFDKKTVSVLENILKKDSKFYLRSVSKETGVSLATTFRIVKEFMKLGLVKKEKYGKFNFYKIQSKAPVFRKLKRLVLGEKFKPIDLLKDMLPNKKIFRDNEKENLFFIISSSKINTSVISKEIEEKTGVAIKLKVLNNN